MIQLSRREFLRMAGVAASAAVLGACAPQTVTESAVEGAVETEVVPTPTFLPPDYYSGIGDAIRLVRTA